MFVDDVDAANPTPDHASTAMGLTTPPATPPATNAPLPQPTVTTGAHTGWGSTLSAWIWGPSGGSAGTATATVAAAATATTTTASMSAEEGIVDEDEAGSASSDVVVVGNATAVRTSFASTSDGTLGDDDGTVCLLPHAPFAPFVALSLRCFFFPPCF